MVIMVTTIITSIIASIIASIITSIIIICFLHIMIIIVTYYFIHTLTHA